MISPQQISATLQQYVDEGAAVGIVTLVAKAGEVVQASAVGMQDREANTRMRRDTIFRIASMSKPLTVATAMTLIDQGKLKLDDPVERWLPELADRMVLDRPDGPLDHVHRAPRSITLLDLMTHRSGLAFDFTVRGPISAAYHARLPDGILQQHPDLTADEWLKRLSPLPLVHNPGEAWLYSVSTDTLGALVERVSGMTFAAYLKAAILDPLGMADTGMFVPNENQSRIAALYAPASDPSATRVRVAAPHPDRAPAFGSGGAGLFSTADDYLKFARMMLGRGSLGDTRVLSSESAGMMTRNWLTPHQRKIESPIFAADFFAAQGFGLNLSILEASTLPSATKPQGSMGSFGWPGGYGTWWQADPVEDLVLIFMVQNGSNAAAVTRPRGVPPTVAFAKFAYDGWRTNSA